ncbi:hypothetical protein SpCBS45565_g04870 [Spizellomyces sp. 'palustris']|nr:hypothetical protein SpCBS45565_g04870 [Spizellomyces sp. 'palustris']
MLDEDEPILCEYYSQMDESKSLKLPAPRNSVGDAQLAIVKVLIQARDFRRARECFDEMIVNRSKPSVEIIKELLELTEECADGRFAKRIYEYLVKHSLDEAIAHLTRPTSEYLRKDVRATVLVIGTLIRRGRIVEAREIYEQGKDDGLKYRTAIFSTLIWALCERGQLEEATSIYHDMQKFPQARPDSPIFTALLEACVKAGDQSALSYFHTEMQARGVKPDVVLYTSLIHGYFNFNDAAAAVDCFEEMVTRGVKLDRILYLLFINVYSRPPHEDPDKVLLWYESMLIAGFQPGVEVVTNMLAMFARRGDVEAVEAGCLQLTKLGIQPDLQVYTTMIAVYARKGDSKSAERWLRTMMEAGIEPDIYTYSALINTHCKAGEIEIAQKIFEQLIARYQAAREKGASMQVDRAADDADIPAAKLAPNAYVYNALIIEFLRNGDRDTAHRYLEEMLAAQVLPDTATFTALIQDYGQRADSAGALRCYQDMLDFGIAPNNHIYSALATAFGKAEAGAHQIELLLADMDKRNIRPDLKTVSSIMFAFGRAGQPKKVVLIWDRIQSIGDTDNPSHSRGTPLISVDSQCFHMFARACFELAQQRRHQDVSEAKHWLERVIDEGRRLIDMDLVFNQRTWATMIGELAQFNNAATAAELVIYALSGWCRARDQQVKATSEGDNHSKERALFESAPATSPLDASISYRGVIKRMKEPPTPFQPSRSAPLATHGFTESIVRHLALSLVQVGRSDLVVQLQSHFTHLLRLYPDALKQEILAVLKEFERESEGPFM